MEGSQNSESLNIIATSVTVLFLSVPPIYNLSLIYKVLSI